jgi:hypothetical protein
VFTARQNKSLNVIQFSFCLQSTEKARVQSQVTPYGPYGGRSSNRTGFSQSTAVLPCRYHSNKAPYSFPCCSYQDKHAKPVGFWNSGTLWRRLFLFFRLYSVNGDISGTDHTPQLHSDELLPSHINTIKKNKTRYTRNTGVRDTTYLFTKYIRHEH